jgi:5'-nucleotidase
MRILLTNDDGVYAPGLAALAEALAELGDVTVVAPASEQSGVALSITYLHPILVREEHRNGRFFAHVVHGSPADCVKLGVLEFCDPEPDLVVSGINSGSNVGINVLYSGTVAGAIEGAFFGKTAVAVSLAQGTPPNYSAAAANAVHIIRQLLATQPPAGSLWNLNLPDTRPDWPLGLKPVRMAVRRRYDLVEKRTDPRGRTYFWSGIEAVRDHESEPGTDVHELERGYATLTPLHFDLTNHSSLPRLETVTWLTNGKRA